jgi:hypothetical protein
MLSVRQCQWKDGGDCISLLAIIAIHQRSFRRTTRTGKLADNENYGHNDADDDIFRAGEESEIGQP